MNLHLLLTCLTLLLYSSATAADYTLYHKAINKAERQIFVSNQIDSGIQTYLATFKAYDFVYLQDCITAIQIALHAKNEVGFKAFVDKATQNGLMPRHLATFRYIAKHPYYAKHKSWIDSVYNINRPRYLKRIDTALLKQVTYLYANDQMQKNQRKDGSETIFTNNRRYKLHINQIIGELKELTYAKGFPSDKLIGIYQKDIMKELGLKSPDLIDYYKNNKLGNPYKINQSQFDLEEWMFASSYLPVMMHHYDNAFLLFDTSYYKQQIALGNIHPKDVAAIHDFEFDTGSKPPIPAQDAMYFGLHDRLIGTGERIPLKVPDSQVNYWRAKYSIAPVEQDRAKWDFMRQHKMFFAFGAMNGDRM